MIPSCDLSVEKVREGGERKHGERRDPKSHLLSAPKEEEKDKDRDQQHSEKRQFIG